MKIALEEDLASRSSSLQSDAYVDAGTRLTFTIVKALGLPGWNDGLPAYTPDTSDYARTHFNGWADAEAGNGQALSIPMPSETIQRQLAALALAHSARIRASAQLVGTVKRALLHAAVPPALRYPDSLLLQNLHKLGRR